uniref:Regulator of chromosome condensation n=1 Tax=Glossina palpalis gambiensis TaxID=67801 RepID=A0A1B0APV1_9MUSC
MPRIAERKKANIIINNAGENDEPKRKMQRVVFQLPLPERPRVTGRVFVCGQGDMGQLGLGDDSSKFKRRRPTLVEKVLNVVDVTAGGMHNLLLTLEGHVYSFGCNDEGALGRDSSEEGSEFVPHAIDLPQIANGVMPTLLLLSTVPVVITASMTLGPKMDGVASIALEAIDDGYVLAIVSTAAPLLITLSPILTFRSLISLSL